jgi:hypothetical protein
LAISSNDSTILHSAVIVQANTSSLAGIRHLSVGQGSTGATSVTLFGGDFDNAYFSSPATGHMLICGTAPTSTIPTLFNLSFDAAAHYDECVAAVHGFHCCRCSLRSDNRVLQCARSSRANRFVLLRVQYPLHRGAPSTNNGCVMARRTAAAVTTTIAAPSRGGTNGIIPDNDSPQPNASSIYFSNQGGSPLAVKLTQQAQLRVR